MSLYPLFPLILSLSGALFIFLIGILDEKQYRFFLILSILNTLSFIPYALYFDSQIINTFFEPVFYYHSLATTLGFLITGLVVFKKGIFSKNHYQLFIQSIKATKWNAYYVLDRKDRIKEMSESVCEELGFTKEQVIGKSVFEVFNKSIRITTFDGVDTNNRSMETYYETYKAQVKPKQREEHELLFQNYEGKSVMLHTVEQPIFILGKYKGRINIGEKRSDFDLLSVEKNLKEAENQLESMRLKFIATLELSEEGLFYIDLDQRFIWGNDQFVLITGLKHNTIDFNDYHKFIKEEDLQTYLGVLSSLTMKKQSYKTTYRLLKNGHYIWVKESGKRIFDDKNSNIIMGSLKMVTSSQYQKTEVSELDALSLEPELYVHVSQLISQHKIFQLMLFELSNIPSINEKYGRNIGNMLMGEYIKKIKTNFMSESSMIFRLSGLVFAVTIVDPRKMDLLKQGIQAKDTFMN
ncbi:MAG TPA: PAS domain S-box protein, partial [Acholeplasma sp.]|nr:PAS domain S-box protein [Acholeplasma sp.]